MALCWYNGSAWRDTIENISLSEARDITLIMTRVKCGLFNFQLDYYNYVIAVAFKYYHVMNNKEEWQI